MDWKQAASVAGMTAAAIGLWVGGHKLGMPPEYTTPAAMALLGGVVGAMKSYKAEKPAPEAKP